jgi:hypothetical protein
MTKVLQIMTMPEERSKLAHQLGVAGIVIGAVATALLTIVAVVS